MAEAKVEYNFLGKSGMKVSNICLGTMTFGNEKDFFFKVPTQTSEELSHKIMDRFADLGGNFIDTADVYNAGLTETIIGNWLKKKERDRFVIGTKVRFPFDPTNPNCVGLSRRHIVASVEKSLERLQTDYIDLYQSHFWDTCTPLDETLRTFDDLIRCGKVRYYGASNVCGWQMHKIVSRIEAMGLNKCISLQQQYNLLARHSELEAFMVCREEGIGVIPWGPLKGGVLAGRLKRDAKPDAQESRLGFIDNNKKMAAEAFPAWSDYNKSEEYWTLMDTIQSVASNHGKSVPQVALRWLLQKDFVPSVIIGATSVAQLEDNMGAATGWALSDEEMALLDDVSPRDASYPYTMLWGINVFQHDIPQNKFIPSVTELIKPGN